MEDSRKQAAREQIQHLEAEIEQLRIGHRSGFHRDYVQFFTHAKEIAQLFKESKALNHTDRQRLWDEVSALCENAREDQNRGRESRVNNSRVKKDVIESEIREAFYWAKSSRSVSDLQEADRLLAKVTERIKDGWGGFTGTTDLWESALGNEGKLTRQDRDYLWIKWRDAKTAIRERREYLSQLHFDHMQVVAGECLNLAHADPRTAKERIRQANAEMKQNPMTNDHYSNVRRMLDEAWQLASRAASQRHQEWREKMEHHIERWTELLEKNDNVIGKLELQIEQCEEIEASARSEDFAATVRGWIEEKLDKIRDIRRTNEELEGKIESAKRKLSN